MNTCNHTARRALCDQCFRKLEVRAENAEQMHQEWKKMAKDLGADLEDLRKSNRRYEKALKFYAGKEAWTDRCGNVIGATTWKEDKSQMDPDGTPNEKEATTKPQISGQVARNALAGRDPFFRYTFKEKA